ncbi:MAG: uroporphyrinogen-III synthase [Gammaproteobacteria bacterium]|nr:uroporphyrinogen-III synthase [Gammaproteobacteria bacterium]
MSDLVAQHSKYFLNTRPVDRAQPLTLALQAAGWCVTELPLLELLPLPLDKQDQITLSQLVEQPVRVIVVVSPTAARLGLDALAALNIVPAQLNIRWLAVGHGTAKVLSHVGIQPEVPALESSEGLIASSALSDLIPNEWVMVWRGIGGRELVQECLLARGVRLQVINLYQRQLPIQTQTSWNNDWLTDGIINSSVQQINKKDSFPHHVVLLSSGESWRYWQMLAGEAALTPWLLVLGQRLMDELCVLTPRIRQLTSLKPEHILHVLADIEHRE